MYLRTCATLLVLLASATQSASFSLFRAPTASFVAGTKNEAVLSARHSEFSLTDEDEVLPDDVRGSDYSVIRKASDIVVSEPHHQEAGSGKNRPEYGALPAGTVVQVQVGDLSLSRKAWKKRRRSGSPLLVPCSILNVDQRSMVRWNLIFLLEKFGKAQADGIRITASELTQAYRKYLKSSLQKQTIALGYDSNDEMIEDLFNKKVQETYGVRLAQGKDGQLVMKAPMSRTKAQRRAAKTPILQFRTPKAGDPGDSDGMLTHTGFLRSRKHNQDPMDRSYSFLPLSAALRVSQKDDVDTGRIEEGSIHAAVVFDYDLVGDAGSPLLTLSLNPRGLRENLKVKPDRKYQPIDDPQVEYQNLKVGSGPYKAKVVRLMKGRALIDMDVGRKLSSEGMVRVMGSLRYQDSVQLASNYESGSFHPHFDDDEDDEDYDMDDGFDLEDVLFNFDDEDMEAGKDENESSMAEELLSLRSDGSFESGTFEDGEIEEDVSELYTLGEDGILAYKDPETGETVVMGSVDEDDFDEDEDENEEDILDDTDEGVDDEDLELDFDMTSLFEENDDGSVAFIDPESGEALEVDSNDEEFEDMLMIKSLIDKYSAPPSPKNVDYTHDDAQHATPENGSSQSTSPPQLVSKRLKVGDEIEVFVRTVSKQSGLYTVTTNPMIQGRKAKELKKESSASKRINRLKKSLGGSLKKIYDLEGHECIGVVKATSHTGEWYYVEPEVDGLPVGVATVVQGIDTVLAAGDEVRVRIAGVDEERGQLAMHLLGKN